MNILVPITELINYFLYSLLVGHVTLQFVPESTKPNISIPKPVLLLSTLGIILFSFGPVLQVIMYFADSVGYGLMLASVLTDFEVGKAWLFTGFMATFLWVTLYVEGNKYLQALWLILMIGAVGYASHVASLSFKEGFFFHSIHFLFVTLWVGILIHVGWFSKDKGNWRAFLGWFTPLATVCILIIMGSGLILMFYIVEPKEYANAWVLPYGQMLLLKHISILPVLLFACINGFLSRKSLFNHEYHPIKWVRIEAITLFIVFSFTGILGTLSPPHDVNTALKSEGPARWMEWIKGDDITAPLHVQYAPTLYGLIFVGMSLLFLVFILLSFIKNTKNSLAIIFSVCFIVTMYLGIILNINI